MAGIFDSGGDSGMTVTIRGDASGAAAAATQAANALAQIGSAAQEAAGQANAALSQLGPTAMESATWADTAMADMQGSLTGMAGAAQESFLGTNGLASTAQIASESLGRSLGSGPSGIMTFLGNVGAGLKSTGQGFLDLGGHILNALNPMNLFTSGIGRMLEVMAGWRLMEGGIQKIGEFASGIFQLPIEMEKAEGSWQYMLNPQRTAKQSLADWLTQGQGIAQSVSDWTKKESINLPYTRQDLIQSISTMSAAGLSAQGIEHYMPILADLAATRSPGVQLSTIAQAVLEGSYGLTRMLRTQLHLPPELLMQYGYQEGNYSTMLPAIAQFAQAQGVTNFNAQGQDVGAAYHLSQTTFWGEWSSFIDRVQNSQIMTGDYGPFGTLKTGLEWVNKFIDANGSDIEKFAHLLGDTLAGGMQDVANAGEGFVQGLQSSGVLTNFTDGFSSLSKWVNDPATQKNLKTIFDELGKPVGDSLRGIGTGLGAVGQGVGQAWQSLGSGGQQGLLNLLSLPGDAAAVFGPILGGNLAALGDLGASLGDLVHGNTKGAGQHLGNITKDVVHPAGGLIDTVAGWFGINTHGAGQIIVNDELKHLPGIGVGHIKHPGFGIAHLHGASTPAGAPGGEGALADALAHTIRAGGATAVGAYDRAHAPDTLGQEAAQMRQSEVRQRALQAESRQYDAMTAAAKEHAAQMQLRIGAALTQTQEHAVQQAQAMHEGVVAHVGGMHTQAVTQVEQMRQGIAAALTETTSLATHHGKALQDGYLGQVRSLTDLATRQMRTLRDQANGVFSDMATSAATWGANLVQELADGMIGKTPVAARAARDVAGALHNNLGFGSPTKEGPGATADQWAPNFMRMFSQGLLQGLPQLAATAGQLAAALGNGLRMGGAATTYGPQTIHIQVGTMTAQDVRALVGAYGDGGRTAASAYAQTLRAPGGYRQFGGLGGVLG